MEVFGDVKALKGAIESKYISKIKQTLKEQQRQLEEVEEETNNKLELLKSRMKITKEMDVKKAHSMTISEEKLKAKKEFEEKRESLIDSVFKEAKKRAKKIAHTKQYTDYLEKNRPKTKDMVVFADSTDYKNIFPKIDIDKNIIGVKIQAKDVIYDFTLDNMIESERDMLRHEVSKTLFN